MEFTKPTENLAGFLRNKIHRNPVQYATWRYREKPASAEYNVKSFETPVDTTIWTTTALDDEAEKTTMWLGTTIGHPKLVWWDKFGKKLGLPAYEDQRLVFWATLRAGPASIPMLAVAMGVLPKIWTPNSPMRMFNLAERDPEKLKKMNVAELASNTVSQKMIDYYGTIGIHSMIAMHHGLVEMKGQV